MSIESVLLKDLKIAKRKRGEEDQDYLGRVVEAVQNCSEDSWKDLSDAVQKWSNKASKAKEAGKEIPWFDDDDRAAEGEAETERKSAASTKPSKKPAKEDDGEAEAEPERKPSGRKPTKAAAEDEDERKPAKKSEKPAPAAKKGESMYQVAKRMIAKNPTIKLEKLLDQLEAKGFTPNKVTVSTVRSDMRNTMFVLEEVGMLPEGTTDGTAK